MPNPQPPADEKSWGQYIVYGIFVFIGMVFKAHEEMIRRDELEKQGMKACQGAELEMELGDQEVD